MTNVLRAVLLGAICVALCAIDADAQIKVVTSTSDLAEFVEAVGGEKVSVDFIVRGTQNPHYIEIKPSYMLKLKSAELFFVIGMRFEIWSQQVIDGSRNSDLRVVDCSEGIEKLEVPATRVDPRMGDVHPFGNPHYWLDPVNIPVILSTIVSSLSEVSPADKEYFRANADRYAATVREQMVQWEQRMRPFAGKRIVTYHTTFTYFVKRFGLSIAGYVEPKPGIPPTPVHVTELIETMRKHGISIIGVEQYYELSVPSSVANAVDGTVIRLVSSVGGTDDVTSYVSLIEHNIREFEHAFQ